MSELPLPGLLTSKDTHRPRILRYTYLRAWDPAKGGACLCSQDMFSCRVCLIFSPSFLQKPSLSVAVWVSGLITNERYNPRASRL